MECKATQELFLGEEKSPAEEKPGEAIPTEGVTSTPGPTPGRILACCDFRNRYFGLEPYGTPVP
jgi:hypothetical protein